MIRAAAVDLQDPTAESLEDLYEHAPCGYLSTTPDGTIVRVNQTYLEYTGYTRDDLLGRRFDTMLPAGSRMLWETRCLPILRLKGELREVALAVTTGGGAQLSILLNSSVVHDEDGHPRLIRTAIFDLTERQDYERDLLHARRAAERSEEQVRILQTASATFDEARSPGDVATELARIARDASDAVAAVVMFLDDTAGTLHSAGGHTNPLGDTLSVESSRPEAEALRAGGIVRIGSLDEADRTFPDLVDVLHRARLSAMTAIPLLENGAAIGILACFYGRRRDADDDEANLQQALTRQAAQALHRIRLHDELRHMAQHDTLTGLANRASMRSRLRRVVAASHRDRHPMAVIFLDLDGFKPINDQLGHAVGDAVLVQVADRLRTVTRQTDTIARFGGDEFVVVCADTDADTAALIAERIRDAIRQPLPHVPSTLPLTVSIGVAVYHPTAHEGPEPDADAMLEHADAAMYSSKRAGKDRNTVVRT